MTRDGPACAAAPLPDFAVQITAPDLAPLRAGNTGVEGVWHFQGAAPGPHLAVTALIHGNEIAGAVALAALVQERPRPQRGTLSLIFANLDAFDRFDPANPTATRFVDEDMNRLWDPAILDGPRQSRELQRARALRPVIDRADILLDLHSMLWPSDPLILCGGAPRGRALACAAGVPPLVVADHGHATGRRLIDYPQFLDPAGSATAILVEAGQHWHAGTPAAMRATIGAVLDASGMAPARAARPAARFAEVTQTVTAATGAFIFVRPFHGGEIVRHRNTLIAFDGAAEVRTPHDDCVLIMPSLRPSRGHTAVRLARLVA